eukprot:3127536-Amphidinium_carterae.1
MVVAAPSSQTVSQEDLGSRGDAIFGNCSFKHTTLTCHRFPGWCYGRSMAKRSDASAANCTPNCAATLLSMPKPVHIEESTRTSVSMEQ